MKIEKEALMNLDELAKEYHLLKDKEGRYYKMKNGKRVEPYVTIIIAGEILEISPITIKKYIKGKHLLPKKIKFNNKMQKGYNLNSIISACSYLLGSISIANKKGVAVIDGQKFTTPHILTKLLKLSHNAIIPRIKKAELKPLKIKVRDGNIRQAYNIAKVKKACADLLTHHPVANSSNIAIFEGQRYTTLENLIRLLKISNGAIQRRIKDNQIQSQKIKVKGKLFKGYKIEEVKSACSDLLKKMPIANSEGMAKINGQKHTSIEGLAKLLKISTPPIISRIKKNKLRPVKIKNRTYGVCNAYNIAKVKKICAELIKNFPKTDTNGFVTIGNQKFATVTTLAKTIGVNPDIVRKRIGHLKPITVKISNGIGKAYNLNAVKKACFDQLQFYPMADSNGIALINGQQFAAINRIYDLHKLSQAINYHKVATKLMPVTIKIKNGHIVNGFNIKEALAVHKKLLNQKGASK